MDLKNFQMRAIADLKSAMRVAGKRDAILKSPTGSGKTVILTRFMQECMREDPSVCFVWLTPGKGNLEEQSKTKMDRYCHNASTKLLADVMTGGFAAGDAAFINWEKLTKKGTKASISSSAVRAVSRKAAVSIFKPRFLPFAPGLRRLI